LRGLRSETWVFMPECAEPLGQNVARVRGGEPKWANHRCAGAAPRRAVPPRAVRTAARGLKISLYLGSFTLHSSNIIPRR
jgi:hypothetical protein